MARKRTIDPDIWTDSKVLRLSSAVAKLLYIGTVSLADDEGRFQWCPMQLRARIFAGSQTESEVIEAMEEIAKVGLVRVYRAEDSLFAWHPSWKKHQYINKKTESKLPAPPDRLVRTAANSLRCDIFTHDSGSSTENYAPVREDYEKISALGIGIRYSVSDSVSDSVLSSKPSIEPRYEIGVQGEACGQPPAADESLSPKKSVRVTIPKPQVPTEFGDKEADVLAVIANDCRQDGTITEKKLLALRQKLGRHLVRYGDEAFAHGLTVGANGAKGVDYATAVMKRFRPGEMAFGVTQLADYRTDRSSAQPENDNPSYLALKARFAEWDRLNALDAAAAEAAEAAAMAQQTA